ncbi:MAG: thermonuclease family protein [Pseudomonadota bacterium]|nr:thermonuclease family protein [Pseudomonadota bacterium]
MTIWTESVLSVTLCVLVLCMSASPAISGSKTMPGPFAAEVVDVYDGDTLTVRLTIWLGQTVTTSVRMTGIDTPELRGRCPEEIERAVLARDRLTELVAGGMTLLDVQNGKYAGRVLGTVRLPDGRDAGKVLISEGLARAYDGGVRLPWCPQKEAALTR